MADAPTLIQIAGATLTALGTLFNIHKRQIDHTNDLLADRKDFATELRENCKAWNGLIEEVLVVVVEAIREQDFKKAEKAMLHLVDDTLKIDYLFIRNDSALLRDLRTDSRFSSFAEACASFYETALNLKRLIYTNLAGEQHSSVSLEANGAKLWKLAIKRQMRIALDKVDAEYLEVRILRKQ